MINIINHLGNANQNPTEIPFMPVRMAIIKSQETTNAGEAVEKRTCLYTVGGNVNYFSLCGKQFGDFSKTWNYHSTQRSHSVYNQKKITHSTKKKHVLMFINELFTIEKTWNQSRCPSKVDWIKKMWYIYTVEYHAAIKKNEIMSFAATWMQLEVIILKELTQEQKTKYCMFSLKSGSYTLGCTWTQRWQ